LAHAATHSPHSLAEALASAGTVIARVLSGQSLNAAIAELRAKQLPPARAAAAQDLSYNALRAYGVVDAALARLLDKPLPDLLLRGLLLAALAELMARPQSAHAIVHQAVEGASALGRPRARGLVNAVLRNFQRRGPELMAELESNEQSRYRHPQWWIDMLRAAYPDNWQSVLEAANGHPPMTLRVNRRKIETEAYLAKLQAAGISAQRIGAQALRLDKPCRVELLPNFAQGEVSVQDAGAQRAAVLLDVQDGMRVLDACAAPGGKTGHILELADVDLTAVDSDAARATRITQNLARLGLKARVLVEDCAQPERFAKGEGFERVLLDAPCSASGVTRRHPDTKWLRRAQDIPSFASTQLVLLDSLWKQLAPRGKLLYVTCSVFPQENGDQIRAFLERHAEAALLPTDIGLAGQLLPSDESDGFYYALLEKRS
jgi:16S rRNA (cytosine967-C5)-methyltransferase